MVYTQKELDAILELTSKGFSKDEALIEMFDSKPVSRIAAVVKEYFNVDTLEPKNREPNNLAPAVVFYYLVCDFCFMPRDTKVHKTAIKYTRHDRSTYISYVVKFEEDAHKYDNRYVHGDALYNHFLKIKGKINQKDYSELMIKPFISKKAEGYKPLFEKVMFERRAEVINFVGEGVSLHDLNNKFFDFERTSTLRYHLRNKYPDINKKVGYKRGTRISVAMECYSSSIKRSISLGDTSKEVNEKYFGYDGVSSFRKAMRKEQNELYLQILENERRRKGL